MDRVFLAGVGVTAAGIAGYVLGIVAPYPGRAFSVTAVMLGITLIAVNRTGEAPG